MDASKVSSRREFVKRAGYMAPAILTLSAAPQYVKAGSAKGGVWDGRDGGWAKDKDKEKDKDKSGQGRS